MRRLICPSRINRRPNRPGGLDRRVTLQPMPTPRSGIGETLTDQTDRSGSRRRQGTGGLSRQRRFHNHRFRRRLRRWASAGAAGRHRKAHRPARGAHEGKGPSYGTAHQGGRPSPRTAHRPARGSDSCRPPGARRRDQPAEDVRQRPGRRAECGCERPNRRDEDDRGRPNRRTEDGRGRSNRRDEDGHERPNRRTECGRGRPRHQARRALGAAPALWCRNPRGTTRWTTNRRAARSRDGSGAGPDYPGPAPSWEPSSS